MKKNKTFATITEAIEAGEPSLIDKITGEIKKADMASWIQVFKGEIVYLENAYRTLSGKFIIIARKRTREEEKAASERYEQAAKEAEALQNERIKAIVDLPGYILIGWRKRTKHSWEDARIIYLPVSGPRFVFQKSFEYTWEKDKNGLDCQLTVKACRWSNLSRWTRKEIVDSIKQSPDNYHLCAPLWLLTSIPDPRPRYLAGEE